MHQKIVINFKKVTQVIMSGGIMARDGCEVKELALFLFGEYSCGDSFIKRIRVRRI